MPPGKYMPVKTQSIDTSIEKSGRPTRERADATRAALVRAATTLFSEQGFDGVSVRDIEKTAGVHRGLLGYHFKSKKALWQLVADSAFGMMREELELRHDLMEDMNARDRLTFIIRFYVRFFSRHPEISRLMSQEARQDSWRIQYLVEKHIKPSSLSLQKQVAEALGLDRAAFVHWYYIMVSASSTIFSFAPECEHLFGVDCRREDRVKAHADMLVNMMLGKDIDK
jgi:AcrR family transcriptional regulator